MYEAEGKLIVVLAEQSGNGKNGVWTKRDFVIETSEQYPKKICFCAWGDKGDLLKQVETGVSIKVVFTAESREFNGKWYTDLKVWKMDVAGSRQNLQSQESFRTTPEDSFDNLPEDPTDILPF